MVKVELFESNDLDILKDEVNKYLKDNRLRMDQIGKIYYNKVLLSHEYSIGKPNFNYFSYSVMIVVDNWREMEQLELQKKAAGNLVEGGGSAVPEAQGEKDPV